MGFLDKIKNTVKGGLDKLAELAERAMRKVPLANADNETPPAPDTSRYVHVSVPLTPITDPIARKLLNMRYFVGKGITYNIGNNAMKREADRLGGNNKSRRRIRTAIKRRAEELRTQGRA